MKKRIVITISLIFFIAILIFLVFNIKSMKQEYSHNITIKNNKDTIYSLFDNFPESKNIYYTSESLYSQRHVGPTIYQIDILAELTDESYNDFCKQIESTEEENLKMKFNPSNIKYNWEKVKNIEILKSKDIEDASVTEIYLDNNNKTIYIIALGGN